MQRMAFILFGEGLQTNVEELNKLLKEGWSVDYACPMPSSISMVANVTEKPVRSFYEPQCVVFLKKF